MFPLSLIQLAEVVSGELTPAARDAGSCLVTGSAMDSRQVQPGDVFFALPGTAAHGTAYATDAIRRGARVVVTGHSPLWSGLADLPVMFVRDPILAMEQLGRWCRQQSDAVVVGITGSVGKTTTRQMLTQVLSRRYSGIQSPANFNNHLGVPLSLMLLKPEHEFAVLELGASAEGEISRLASMSKPELGVVTRVAAAHLSGFGDLAGVQRAKAELPAALDASGTAFLNGDDPLVRQMAETTTANVILFGEAPDCDFRLSQVEIHDLSISFCVNESRFQLPTTARHLITSAAATIAVSRLLGISDDEIREGLREFVPACGRSQVVCHSPWVIIDDSYNASPASVESAIQQLTGWTGGRHRILVLADMLELGEASEQLHFEAGRLIGRSSLEHVLLLGDWSEVVAAGVRSIQGRCSQSRVSVFRDFDTLVSVLECIARPGDVLLVKGSRGMRMERVVSAMLQSGEIQNRRVA